MRVSVFGLGYVGCVSVACLSRLRHNAIGVDIMKSKVDAIANGIPTVVEPEVTELVEEGHREGRITATTDAADAVHQSDASLVCVGTPTGRSGEHILTAVEETADAIGQALMTKSTGHLVVIRSTVKPGTIETLLVPKIVREDNPHKDQISVVIIPEFLRESTAVRDYYNPPLVVVGTVDGKPDIHQGAIAALLAVDPEKVMWVQYRVAEMMKGLCNVFHALKVAFANEVGALCSEIGVDGRQVMHLLTQDRKLNISPAYLRPGMPYGGSCLPKDLRATVALAENAFVDTPLLKSIEESNEAHKQRAFEAVLQTNGYRCVAMDGLAFKAGTDDLRESPMVPIAEHLIGKGYDLKILDPAVKTATLTGANREYIEQRIPHLADRLVSDVGELLEHVEVLILTRDDDTLFERAKLMSSPPFIIDLTGAGREIDRTSSVESTVPVAAVA